MNLAIDIGNTSTKFAIFNNHKIVFYFRIPTSPKINPVGIFKNLPQSSKNNIKQIGISSVVPSENVMYRQSCIKYFNIKPLIISTKNKLPVNVMMDEPLKTGADRLCIAVSGYEYFYFSVGQNTLSRALKHSQYPNLIGLFYSVLTSICHLDYSYNCLIINVNYS